LLFGNQLSSTSKTQSAYDRPDEKRHERGVERKVGRNNYANIGRLVGVVLLLLLELLCESDQGRHHRKKKTLISELR